MGAGVCQALRQVFHPRFPVIRPCHQHRLLPGLAHAPRLHCEGADPPPAGFGGSGVMSIIHGFLAGGGRPRDSCRAVEPSECIDVASSRMSSRPAARQKKARKSLKQDYRALEQRRNHWGFLPYSEKPRPRAVRFRPDPGQAASGGHTRQNRLPAVEAGATAGGDVRHLLGQASLLDRCNGSPPPMIVRQPLPLRSARVVAMALVPAANLSNSKTPSARSRSRSDSRPGRPGTP